VTTAATPGAASAAATSTARIAACACTLRTNATCSMWGSATSLT
jgi:hypothetical protein